MNSGWKPGQGRRNRNSGKGLDDVLGDLLGGDDSPPTKPSQTWPGKSTKPAPKKRGNDEDFYSSLAADYDEEESDVSAADPDEMAKTLNDLDDMDADLFGPSKKKATPKKSQPPANKPTPVNKPTPAKTKEPDFSFDDGPSSPVAAPAPKVSSSPAAKPKAKSYDFGDFDEDDPLAGLLSDDEDDKPKKKPAAKKAPLKKEPQVDIEKSDDRPGTSRGRKPIEKTAPQKTVKDDLFSDDDDGLAGLGDSPPPKPKEQPKPVKSKKDVLNFDDDSDPLAGLDDSPRKEKPKPKKTKKDEINFSDDDDPLASLDEKPKNVKPASKSGGRKKNDDLDFDDGDVLGTMGFDDSPRKSKDDDDDDAPKGRSMLDSLLGKDSVSKHLEKPAPSQKREFVLDDKYRKKDNVAKEKKVVEPSEDDFNFGDYMPSAAATMKPSGSKRSVRFQEGDDDDFFGLSTYPAARGGARRGRGGISATLDDDGGDDWLSMASGTSSDKPKTTSPPESKKEPKKKSTADSMDWLGLGDSVKETKTEDSSDWLGRPSNKKAETKLQSGGDAMESPRRPQEKTPASPHAKKPSTLTKQNSRDNNDWLGLGNEVEKEPPASKDRDWLGIGDSSLSPDKSESGDWLGYAAKKPQEKEEKGFSDWLGIKDTPTKKPQEKTAASPRTQKSATLKKENSKDATDDWLGLGKDVEPEAPVTQPSPRPPRADERGLDLFSPPKKQQSASSLPWETGKSKQTPQPSASTPLAQPLSSSTPLPQKVPDPPHAQSVPNLSTPTPQSNVASQMEQLQKMQQEQDRMYQENLKKQEEALVEAQRQAMIQQQEQQAALQRQIQEQQELQMKMKSEQIQQQMQEQQRKMQEETMRMEQQFKEQQLKQQQQIQQQQMQQQLQQQQQQQQMLQQPSLLNTSQLPGLGMSAIFSPQQHMVNMEVTQQRALADNTIAGLELETKVRKLEIERDHLQSMLESIKLRHADEISAIDASNKSKLSIIEESFQRREMRLKEENELLAGQNLSKVRQIEEEKSKMVSEQFAKYAEWEREKNQEIERLKELHKNSLETMRKDHEEAVERLRKVKDQEIAAASSGHEHSKSMQVVLEQMQMNTRDLGHLQYKISNHHTAGLDDREITMRAKDEKLSVMEERLLKQQEENDKERIRLQELVAKMELQIREQGRQLEEERWRVKKEQSRLDALQHSLEEETRINTERVTRERRELQKAREDLLTEQKSILSQLYEERRVLSSERAEFNVSQRLLLNREQSDSFRTVRASAELEGTLNKLAEDKAHIGTRMEELKMETERIASERTLLEQEKLKLADEQEKLSQLALQLKQRSAEVEQMSVEAARVHSEGTQALAKAKATESGHHVQLYEAEAKIETLRKKERQIAQERLAIAKERRQLQNVQNSLTCQSCRTPVKDTATALADYNSAHGHPQVSRLLPMSQTPVVDLVNDRQTRIKVWQISAEKDKEFLADESLFLESLKYSPYSSQNIAS